MGGGPEVAASTVASSNNVVLVAVIAVIATALGCLIIALGVRQFRRRSSAPEEEEVEKASRSNCSIYEHGTFGFSMGSKLSGSQAPDADTVSTAASALSY